jgi:hypothetical protein
MMLTVKQASVLVLTAFVAVIGFASVSQAADGQSVYFQSGDFPFDVFVQKPVPPEENTRFYQLLDQAFKQNNLVLSNQKETANYWATLHCSGLFNCADLQLDLTTPDRVVMASVRMPGKKYPWSKPDLEGTATAVAKALQNRIDALPEGGTGTYDTRGFRH